MVDTECLGFDCEGNTAETLTCTFDKPERPDLTGLGEDEIAELKADFKAKKKECKQKMIQCACCADMSVDDILAAMGKAGGASSFVGGYEKFPMGNAFSSTSGDSDRSSNSLSDSTSGDQSEPIQGSDKEGGPMPEVDDGSVTSDSSGDGDGSSNSLSNDGSSNSLSDTSGDQSEPIQGSDKEGGPMPEVDDGSVTSDSSGDGDGSFNSLSDSSSDASSGGKPSGRPGSFGGGGGMDIQAILAEKCQEIDDDKCAGMANQNIDCDRFDSMMTANTRGKFKKILYCGCCRD
jgi:hypothetical protein